MKVVTRKVKRLQRVFFYYCKIAKYHEEKEYKAFCNEKPYFDWKQMAELLTKNNEYLHKRFKYKGQLRGKAINRFEFDDLFEVVKYLDNANTRYKVKYELRQTSSQVITRKEI